MDYSVNRQHHTKTNSPVYSNLVHQSLLQITVLNIHVIEANFNVEIVQKLTTYRFKMFLSSSKHCLLLYLHTQ